MSVNGTMIYCIDTSFFIESWRRYPLDVFPSFWLKIEQHIDAGSLVSVDEVWEEINRKDDELRKWLKPRKQMFVPLDLPTMSQMKQILTDFPHMVQQGKDRNSGDVVVIAHAHVNSLVVVTEEKPNKKNGIPQICQHYSLTAIDTVQLLRQLRIKF